MAERTDVRADLAARRVVAFDFDGTLADTRAGIVGVASTVLRRHGVGDDDLTRVGDIVGPPFPQAFQLVFGLSEEESVEVTREYRAIYHNLGPDGWPLFAGVRELLVTLKADGRILTTASSKRVELLRAGLTDNGVIDLFDLVLGKTSDEGFSKAQVLARAVDALGMTSSDVVMVGDRRFDVEAAHACSIPCVGVEYGGTAAPGELERAGAVAVVGSVEELGRLLLGGPR
ncbi:HAD family hydrolase [Olsenella massiliensis]|uniref:HAD family hydrolase n=1 Tax=Olsenella massiliensis TaxID=1622075 RepID=UPI00071E63E7|nr:HAD hydrolase-like protein [Olsenella massiliensis]